LIALEERCSSIINAIKEASVLLYTQEFYETTRYNNAKFISILAQRIRDIQKEEEIRASMASATNGITSGMQNMSI
jgi:hypothetical protein